VLEVVKGLEVLVVPRQDSPPFTDGMRKVDLVTAAGQSDVGRDLDVMSVTVQQSDEAGIDGGLEHTEGQADYVPLVEARSVGALGEELNGLGGHGKASFDASPRCGDD
jgi:hypothetical protein